MELNPIQMMATEAIRYLKQDREYMKDEFQVNQYWKTRKGFLVQIKEISDDIKTVVLPHKDNCFQYGSLSFPNNTTDLVEQLTILEVFDYLKQIDDITDDIMGDATDRKRMVYGYEKA